MIRNAYLFDDVIRQTCGTCKFFGKCKNKRVAHDFGYCRKEEELPTAPNDLACEGYKPEDA